MFQVYNVDVVGGVMERCATYLPHPVVMANGKYIYIYLYLEGYILYYWIHDYNHYYRIYSSSFL